MTTTAKKPATTKAANPVKLEAVKEVEQETTAETTKAATFAAFIEQEAQASKLVTLGEFVKEHNLEVNQGLKVKIAKHLKHELGFKTSKGGNGSAQCFNRSDLEDFFQINTEEA